MSETESMLVEEEENRSNPAGEAAEAAMNDEEQQSYSWSVIQFNSPPQRTYHFYNQFRTGPNPNNFFKGVKWPDYGNDVSGNVAGEEDSFTSNLVVGEGESVYDFCWYPYMSASDPVTCVFANTTRDHPIHLWDAASGELRCTYRAYDAMDEITAAFSISFNPAGTKIFAGYNKLVRIFDLHRPGRDFGQHSTLQGNKEGQTGIISAIAFSPTHNGMLALGSYSQTTGIYREDNMELLYVLHGQEGGITHIQFSKDGNYLYTGGRKDPYILCWDIRKSVDVVYKLYRSSEHTNQRIFFDIEPCGQHLGTGDENCASVWSFNFASSVDGDAVNTN
ncbi:Telomerase Cajal body protein 1, partial [Cucurbita argyrosperma subsp. sororia]